MKEGKRKKEEARTVEQEARMRKEEQKRILAAEKKEFDFERSRIASEKFQLAWIKANITFIALGFAAYKFYQSRVEQGKHTIGNYVTGKQIGIFLTLVGFAMLSLATRQHFNKVAQLKLKYGKSYYSVALLLAYFVLGFDLIVLAMIIFRL